MATSAPITERMNPAPNSTGLVMWELWEITAHNEFYLLEVSSSRESLESKTKTGDIIVKRTWAPASAPDVQKYFTG